jgi:uncharacterized lipoprotein
MRFITTILAMLAFLSLAACDGKADYEKKAEKDADARRAINTGVK